MPGTEIRIHGIGDHQPYSELGSARALSPGDMVDDYPPPTLPDHNLRLVNWSRTSRRVAGFLWYLALPYTLVNVAGEMAPRGRIRRRTFQLAVTGASLMLSLATLTWLLAVVETVEKKLPVPGSALITQLLFVAAIAAMTAAMVKRIRMADRFTTRWSRGLGYANVVGVVMWGMAITVFRPAVSPTLPLLPDSCTPAGGNCQIPATLDFATVAVMFTWVAVVAFAALAWGAAAERQRGALRRSLAPGPGAFLALTTAIALVHTAGSALRLGLDRLIMFGLGNLRRTTI